MFRADINMLLDHYLVVATTALGTEQEPFSGKAFIQPGAEVAWDQCDCDGQAWSRLVSAEPVYGTRNANGKRCVVRWDVTLAVGVLRCVEVPRATGQKVRLPSAEQITADGHRFGNDFLALMTAIECDPLKDSVVNATPLGPNGGCAGSEVQFTVRMTPCCP